MNHVVGKLGYSMYYVNLRFHEEVKGHVGWNVDFFSLGSQALNDLASYEVRLQKWGKGWKSGVST